MKGKNFNKPCRLTQKLLNTHYNKKNIKNVDFGGLLFFRRGINHGTIQ
jgi:hypothetical protein